MARLPVQPDLHKLMLSVGAEAAGVGAGLGFPGNWEAARIAWLRGRFRSWKGSDSSQAQQCWFEELFCIMPVSWRVRAVVGWGFGEFNASADSAVEPR